MSRGGDHDVYVHHNTRGEKTGAYTYFSRGGRKAIELGPQLLKRMCLEPRLGTIREVRRLLSCPMGAEEYAGIVARAG